MLILTALYMYIACPFTLMCAVLFWHPHFVKYIDRTCTCIEGYVPICICVHVYALLCIVCWVSLHVLIFACIVIVYQVELLFFVFFVSCQCCLSVCSPSMFPVAVFWLSADRHLKLRCSVEAHWQIYQHQFLIIILPFVTSHIWVNQAWN